MKILFTSVGRRVELIQAFRSAADQLSAELQIFGAEISSSAPALCFCDKTALVPRIHDAEYIPALLDICKKENINLLIPTIDTDLLLLARHKADFQRVGTVVLISDPEKIAICRDKRKTSNYFRSIGLLAPDATDNFLNYRGGFPAFIKPVDGSSSIGAHRADTPEQLAFYAKQLGEYVVQPFAEGTEYTVDILCDFEGNPVYITPRIRLAVRAGEVLKTQICHQKQIVEEMLHLISDFKPCGPITVQLIRDEERKINRYIEINPRFGGGAPLSMKAGADSATALLCMLRGDQRSYLPEAAEEGAIYSRFDQNVRVK